MHLLVQSTSGSAPVSAVRARIREMDPQLPLDDVQELPVVLASSLAQPRLYVLLLGTFAVAALALAGLGVYGIISTWVAERQRDVGIRVALGSSPQGVVKLVVGQSLKPLLAGLAAGLVIALAGSRVIASLLYGVSTTDAATYALVAIFLVLVALTASYIPARRASRLDPAVVLRDAE
jgi:ABC-type antimicrobial peptide transport system permease subunit